MRYIKDHQANGYDSSHLRVGMIHAHPNLHGLGEPDLSLIYDGSPIKVDHLLHIKDVIAQSDELGRNHQRISYHTDGWMLSSTDPPMIFMNDPNIIC